MEIKKDKYLKELKKLGLDDLKAKSFLYDLEKDLTKTKPQEKKKSTLQLNRKKILYGVMGVIMVIYLIWIYSSSPEQGTEVIKNITQNITQNVTNIINETMLVNQSTIVN